MENKNTLNGFEAILESLNPNVGANKTKEIDNIDNELPFFGNVLGDTYGFGLTTIYTPGGTSNAELSVVLYYDVPLGLDYTIDAPLKDIKDYLVSLGFVENKYGEFNKDNIWISPQDSNLDLVIYVWKK